jgi:beta-glucosidase
MYHQQLPGTNDGAESAYDAAYAFGAGLSYTTYSFDSVTPEERAVRAGSAVGLKVKVFNTGARDGDLVVPVYASRPVSDVLAPPRKLVAFQRVHLKAGESRTLAVSVPARALAVTPGDLDGAGEPRVEPGRYVFTAGASGAGVSNEAGGSAKAQVMVER